eukprot:scaffold1453_cov112-Isochrysis_galbana.AAC.22
MWGAAPPAARTRWPAKQDVGHRGHTDSGDADRKAQAVCPGALPHSARDRVARTLSGMVRPNRRGAAHHTRLGTARAGRTHPVPSGRRIRSHLRDEHHADRDAGANVDEEQRPRVARKPDQARQRRSRRHRHQRHTRELPPPLIGPAAIPATSTPASQSLSSNARPPAASSLPPPKAGLPSPPGIITAARRPASCEVLRAHTHTCAALGGCALL